MSDMNLYILAKVSYDDLIPPECSRAWIVENGKLIVRMENLYEFQLSLSFLDIKADWMVLDAKILVISDVTENFNRTYDPQGVDRGLVEVLQTHSTPGLSPTDSSKRATLSRFHELCMHTAVATALRLLYIQALDMSKNDWMNYLEVEFIDAPQKDVVLSARFWKGIISK